MYLYLKYMTLSFWRHVFAGIGTGLTYVSVIIGNAAYQAAVKIDDRNGYKGTPGTAVDKEVIDFLSTGGGLN